MVNAYETPGTPSMWVHGPDPDMDELRQAVRDGAYSVSSRKIAEALLSWHQGLSEGRMSHEAAPLLRTVH